MSEATIAAEMAGAQARAAGSTEFDCPLFHPSRMPASDTITLGEWSDCAEAWRRGWIIEDAMRSRA